MVIHLIYIASGLALLVWSADWFVEGSAAAAKHLGMPPLLIGMVVVGFGTSAPEMLVSALAAVKGNPGISLGNAYGSNICNIALILGVTAMISPIAVQSDILKKELPILTGVTGVAILQAFDGHITRFEAGLLIFVFSCLMIWSVIQQRKAGSDSLEIAVEKTMEHSVMSLGKSAIKLTVGLVVLIGSSRLLVTGAVRIAESVGVSDLMIGLTIVAFGTSLPEFASSIAAARKNEHDIALGNIIGSNLFNTLAVVGIAGLICPMAVDPAVLYRDLPVMTGLTVSIFLVGYGFKNRMGRINRYEGLVLLVSYFFYTAWLLLA